MPMTISPGTRLFSAVDTTELIVIRAPDGGVDLTIGGAPPASSSEDGARHGSVADGFGGGVAMGKRYVDAAGTIELLCTRPGDGVPAVDGIPLTLKESKPLPSSD